MTQGWEVGQLDRFPRFVMEWPKIARNLDSWLGIAATSLISPICNEMVRNCEKFGGFRDLLGIAGNLTDFPDL